MDISGRKARGCHGDHGEFHRHTHPSGRGELHTFYVPDWALFFFPIRVHLSPSPFDRIYARERVYSRGCGWSRDFRVDGFLRVAYRFLCRAILLVARRSVLIFVVNKILITVAQVVGIFSSSFFRGFK